MKSKKHKEQEKLNVDSIANWWAKCSTNTFSNWRVGLVAVTMVLALVVVGCQSPLDPDVPRNVTPITPAVKVTPSSVTYDFSTSNGVFQFVGTPIFKVDTTSKPMRIWVDYTMDIVKEAGKTPVINQYRCKLDSFAVTGYFENLVNREVSMLLDIKLPAFEEVWSSTRYNLASAVIAEHTRVAGQPRKITLTLYLDANDEGFFAGVAHEKVLGIVTMVF
ncbi:MAG: hypothetical protein HQ472_04535 [Ignavibacteria bacterium]|nr:hypothetical protein [Ignavibacteria bacterium]